ncbi:biotin synthase auxiliary protein BsaP [Lolliginicoccus suaedae]|uniref:biotin synthase auxiliary protein BsaP n=1 Tax=Lolliginicoccus suaedae TaxID=2605429 RepID=UPI0038B3037B
MTSIPDSTAGDPRVPAPRRERIAKVPAAKEIAPRDGGPLGSEQRFSVYTGSELAADATIPSAAQLGLEPPRYCGQCGRRMVVQIDPVGWWAQCSRHGRIHSNEIAGYR